MSTIDSIIFVGTGTSSGVPTVACLVGASKDCKVCLSTLTAEGKKNIRRNTSLAVRIRVPGEERLRLVLIDCGKTFYGGSDVVSSISLNFLWVKRGWGFLFLFWWDFLFVLELHLWEELSFSSWPSISSNLTRLSLWRLDPIWGFFFSCDFLFSLRFFSSLHFTFPFWYSNILLYEFFRASENSFPPIRAPWDRCADSHPRPRWWYDVLCGGYEGGFPLLL